MRGYRSLGLWRLIERVELGLYRAVRPQCLRFYVDRPLNLGDPMLLQPVAAELFFGFFPNLNQCSRVVLQDS
jgi:hypothetical protein